MSESKKSYNKSFLPLLKSLIPTVDADDEEEAPPVTCTFYYKTIPSIIMHESPSATDLATQVD
jgi:hypothetical protein